MRGRLMAGWLVALAASSALAGEPATVTQEDLLSRAAGADAPFVLDVRTHEEFVAGHVPGAANIPHDQVAARIAEVPKDRPVVLYCRSGRRAGMAAQELAERGYTRLALLEGDMPAWIERGRAVETPKDPAACLAALAGGDSAPKACTAD